MAKSREKKEAAIAELQEKLSGASAAVLADYRGLNVKEMTELRRQLQQENGELRVVKNTLTRMAAAAAGLSELTTYLTGPTALVITKGDEVVPARKLLEFAKEHKALEIKGGLLQGQVLLAEQVKRLAELPPRAELLAQVAGGIQSPLVGFAGALRGLLCNLVYVVDAVRRQKEGEAV